MNQNSNIGSGSGKELKKMLSRTYYCGKQVKIRDVVKTLQGIVKMLGDEANNNPHGANATVPVGMPLGQLVFGLEGLNEHTNNVDMTGEDDDAMKEEEETPRTQGVARALANLKRPGEFHQTPEFLKKPRFD